AKDSNHPRPLRDRLVAAIVDGSDADIPALRAAAHAEESAVPGRVTSKVRAAVLVRMVEIYDEVALGNYGRVAEVFNDWASKFATTAAAVDVETDDADMVDKSDRDRKSWLDSQRFATQLTRLMSALHAAAQLTGKVPEAVKKRDGGGRDAVLIPLCANISDKHRRVVWEAWE